MSKIGLIIKSEYLRRVAKKSFILLTFLVPILFAATFFIPLWLSGIDSNREEHIAVVDRTGKYKQVLANTTDFKFDVVEPLSDVIGGLPAAGNYDAVILIDNDLLVKPSVTIFSEKQVTPELKRYVEQQLSAFVEDEKLASYAIPNLKAIVEQLHTEIEVTTVKMDENGTANLSSSEVASVVGLVFMMLIYFFVFTYGSMVMNGVLQEKTNRIVEVLICSVKPFELMLGKIISIALVGLTQFLLWLLFVVALIFAGGYLFDIPLHSDFTLDNPNTMAQMMQHLMSINFAEIVTLFLVYFVGGYLLYASLFAAIGAAVDSDTDTQQFVFPIMIPILFAMYAAIYSIENPDGPLAFWCSMIPFTSPVVMMVRLPFGVALWQKIVSIVVLVITFLITTWLAAKIYRTGILMYGKKVTWRELWKWIKYKN